MTKLYRIDFSRCELPPWQDVRYTVHYIPNIIHPVHIRNGGIGSIAVRGPNQGDPWRIGTREVTATFAELEKLKAICTKVDAFIDSELKRIEEEKMPPWRSCTEAEARANPHLSQFSPLGHSWQPMTMCPSNTPLMHQTCAPKPEPKKQTVHDSSVHCPRCGSTKMRSGTVKTNSGIEIVPCAPWITSNGVTAVQYRPVVTTANCVCICGASFESREEHWPEQKPEPNMPRVKAPEGWRWKKNKTDDGWSLINTQPDNHGDVWCTPRSKSDRDAMLACVAAYDQQHGMPWFQHPANDGRMYQLVEASK